MPIANGLPLVQVTEMGVLALWAAVSSVVPATEPKLSVAVLLIVHEAVTVKLTVRVPVAVPASACKGPIARAQTAIAIAANGDAKEGRCLAG
jgi:hypothetical protein